MERKTRDEYPRNEPCLSRNKVIPVRKCNNSLLFRKHVQRRTNFESHSYLTVVNVIEITVGVIRIINNQGSTQAITILGLEMAMIPICPLKYQRNLSTFCGGSKVQYRLLKSVEPIEETLIRYNGTLSNRGSTIGVIGIVLEEAVPVLQRISLQAPT